MSERVTIRLTPDERSELVARAEASGLELSQYIRCELTRPAGVSKETALVLAEIGRMRESLMRLWARSCGEPMEAEDVFAIVEGVEAIASHVFVARATRLQP